MPEQPEPTPKVFGLLTPSERRRLDACLVAEIGRLERDPLNLRLTLAGHLGFLTYPNVSYSLPTSRPAGGLGSP